MTLIYDFVIKIVVFSLLENILEMLILDISYKKYFKMFSSGVMVILLLKFILDFLEYFLKGI